MKRFQFLPKLLILTSLLCFECIAFAKSKAEAEQFLMQNVSPESDVLIKDCKVVQDSGYATETFSVRDVEFHYCNHSDCIYAACIAGNCVLEEKPGEHSSRKQKTGTFSVRDAMQERWMAAFEFLQEQCGGKFVSPF